MNNIRVNFNILKFIECNKEKEDLFGVDIEYKDDIKYKDDTFSRFITLFYQYKFKHSSFTKFVYL
jgi:hypothetical protein